MKINHEMQNSMTIFKSSMNLKWHVSALMFLFFTLSSLSPVANFTHTQNKMIYLAPGDNHIALEIEN